MSDIEDELLALAGGDVSDDEQEASDRSHGGLESPPPSVKREKGVPATKPTAKKAKKHAQPDGSEDEGEA